MKEKRREENKEREEGEGKGRKEKREGGRKMGSKKENLFHLILLKVKKRVYSFFISFKGSKKVKVRMNKKELHFLKKKLAFFWW